uniref:SKP1-like protein n=1 Tax=Oryza punctata TaxID=4537 RepID=A0A0E0LNK1_ORYPU
MATGSGEAAAAAAAESGGVITLKSNEGKAFVVTEASARQSTTIGNMIDDGCTKDGIPLPNVDSKTLEKVIQYCDEHGNSNSGTDEERAALRRFDKDFIGELDGDRAFLASPTPSRARPPRRSARPSTSPTTSPRRTWRRSRRRTPGPSEEHPSRERAMAAAAAEEEVAVEKKGEGAEAAEEKEKDSGSRMITLKSNDEEVVEVTEASARQSNTIANMIDDDCAEFIPLPNVDSKTLAMVIQYCDEHGNSNSGTDEERAALRRFDRDFIGELDKDKASLIKVIMAANYLNIQGLLDITCQHVVDTIKSSSDEEIREAFDIEDDLTEAEKEEIRKENAWAFEEIP